MGSPWRWAARSWPRLVVTIGTVALLAVVLAVVVAQHDDGGTSESPSTTTTSSPSDVPVPPFGSLRFLPENAAGNGPRAPLTGLPVDDPKRLDRAAIAVKIDNLDLSRETARPQDGIVHADVVIEEVVEGGITRFLALLHSTDGPEAGPVRSARTTDAHLLPAFGRLLFAHSGGNPGVIAAIRAAPSIIDRGGEWEPAYARHLTRKAPHNLYLRPWELWALGGGSRPPALASFRRAARGSRSGTRVRGVHIRFEGQGASVFWIWLPEYERWVRVQRNAVHVDASGYAVGPRNVIVMEVDYGTSAADRRSPEADTVGSGPASIFTDGKLLEGRWERLDEDAPFSFLDRAGRPVSLTPGRTWIELVRSGTTTVLR